MSLNLLSELRTLVQSDLNVSSTSSLFPSTTIDLAINRAYRKAGGLFRWPALEDSQKTSGVADQEYYDAPQTWRPDSIWRVEVDDDQYGETPDGSPMAYADYLIWRADSDNDSSTDKKWASQWLRYFIYPVITANGSNNITVWGMMNVEDLENNSDTTIFSYSMPECNEAIVLEAGAILKSKGENEKSTEFKSLEAKQVLALSFDKIKREQAKYEKTQPFLNVPNYYGKTIPEDEIGDF